MRATDVMTTGVITVDEFAPLGEIADLIDQARASGS